MQFNQIKPEHVGQSVTVLARVERVFQTGGPTLFTLFDGYGQITAKGFLRPGGRAYPEIDAGDVVAAEIRVQDYDGKLEGELIAMEKRDPLDFAAQITEANEKRFAIGDGPFLIQSEWLDTLRPVMKEAAILIKRAIYAKRPIIVRHNADCDGYSGAFALERAMVPLLKEVHGDNYQWRFYRRGPSRAPFYAYSDAVSDVGAAETAPLIIVVDSGSGKEDALAIKQVNMYGCTVIVVDHHVVSAQSAGLLADVFVNPWRAGGDSRMTSGMLGAEIARMIYPHVLAIEFLPALSGMGDKSTGPVMEQYVALAQKQGLDADYLKKTALAIDYAAHSLRFMEGKSVVDDLLGADLSNQKEIVELLYTEARGKLDRALEVIKKYLVLKRIKGAKVLATFELEKALFVGDFPPYGKVTGWVSDWLNSEHKNGVYVLGIASDMMVIRVSATETFDLNKIVAQLLKEKPYAGISGGGHEKAGTIKFVPAARDEVVAFVENYIGG